MTDLPIDGAHVAATHVGDCLDVAADWPDDCVDLVFASPPYEDARSYGLDFSLAGRDWVDWAMPRYMECLRLSRGLVAWVVEGRTRKFEWSATPMMLAVAVQEAGGKLRKPPIYRRVGIPGSGGPDWLRNDYELIICATKRGRLPWADNTALGHLPKYPPGGGPTYQTRDGRINRPRPQREGDEKRVRVYKPPAKSNPGNVIDCQVGGGHMGSDLAHENEAPFPERLADFFVRSFCSPDGVVLDCFAGSGTTAAAAIKAGRNAVSIDVRQSQVDLTERRLHDILGNEVGSCG